LPMAIVWSFLRLLQRAFNLSVGYMGTTAFAVGMGLLVFLLMEAYAWRREGFDSMKKRWTGSAGLGLLATTSIWLLLFFFCVAKVIYDDHQDLVKANIEKIAVVEKQKKTIGELETKLKEQPKVVYRDRQTPITTDTGSRHLTKIQRTRLIRMFSALDSGIAVALRTIADNQEAVQYASEINETLNLGRNINSFLEKGMFFKKIPEGIFIIIPSDTEQRLKAAAEHIGGEMVALGIAIIITVNPSYPKDRVTIFVGAKAID
jgi:hypothetical protein